MAYAQKLAWLDIETTALPKGNDWSGVHILEIAVVVTDFALNKEAGSENVIKMTQEAADLLRANAYTREMHQKNGLIRDSAASTTTLAEAEQEIVAMLKETGLDKEEFMIAGSGVATFDLQLIKAKMPELASWLAYYPFDIGVVRRMLRILNGNQDLVPVVKASYGPDKAHRALADVEAHLAEAEKYQEFLEALRNKS